METATLTLVILAAGLASQWLAWRLRLPAIVVLIAAGLVLGPALGIVEFSMTGDELTSMIGLGVAIILFEGGMDLKLGEFRRVGHGIGRLTLIAPPIAMILGALAAHYVGGISWPVAWVLGAILVVTGPTVIAPLLRQARLNNRSASLLKWEGIVNDPVGVLLAVLAFQYFTVEGETLAETAFALGSALVVAGGLGAAAGWITGLAFQRGWVPEHLKPPLLMVLVLVVFEAGNAYQYEAGLLSVTVMGVVLGNLPLGERAELQRFKENLTIILLSVLFIVIPSQLTLDSLAMIDLRIVLLLLVVLFVLRPVTILLSTIGAPIQRNDRWLLAWIAPRGIVAAATAGIFGPDLVAAGHADAELLLPVVFAVILITVLAHGLTLGWLGQKLDLAAKHANGLLIVGASRWSVALASTLKQHEYEAMIVDGSFRRLREARMEGIETYYGEILSEHAELELEDQHLGHLLCATDNDFYNALVCKALGHEFGRHRTFQLATHEDGDHESRQLNVEQRGQIAFDGEARFETLVDRLDAGWTIQTTRLTDEYGLDDFVDRMGEPVDDWLLLGALGPDGQLRLYSDEQAFEPSAGWTVLYFAPDDDAARAADSNPEEDGPAGDD
ncbi:sodium:proton antiporter [Wenzhouxiangella sp. XN79A]|uniref:cation:proton antiporter n=1 Tax=Wenzhouxiangella sp. XN79A TaxID=2724193 RepID=UPI00144A9BA4|nr:sodium:proton antiporter [Wenzhouxiangella sp. XN79A]NKI34961.1 sodium:proton antiporter [Wenzhouxiangella sp. XN79A]